MKKKKTIIMVRVNEYTSRNLNSNIPFTPDEIAETAKECEKAGASIIHFHARKNNGDPCHDPDVYLEIVSKIREKSNLIIDSTLGQITVKNTEERTSHIRKMKDKPFKRTDMAALDVGSTNIDTYDFERKNFLSTDKTYHNSIETCLSLVNDMDNAGVKPHLTCWTIPFLRTADALIDMGVIKEPAYVQLAFCEGGILGGHPCTIDGALSFVRMMPKKHIEWTVTCKGGNLLPAAAVALEYGGHLSPGIGDYSYPELEFPNNSKLVEFFANLSRSYGRDVANVDESRLMLGL